MARKASAAIAALVVVFAGCGDKETGPGNHEKPAYLPRTSAANLMHNLRQSVTDRDLAQYDSLLADDFVYVVSLEDQPKPDMPEEWGRESELSIVTRMFDPDSVQTLALDFVTGPVLWNPVHRLYMVPVSDESFRFRGFVPGRPDGPTEVHATGARAKLWFRKNGWFAPGTVDSVWTVVYWEETPPEGDSWGTIRAAFDSTGRGEERR
jgi:hypothetical protein